MERLGVVVSRLIVLETVVLFPATSLAWNSIPCTPSGTPTLSPVIHGSPSSRYCRPDNPEVVSEPEPVTEKGEMCQPFSPSAGGTDTVMFGGVVSNLIFPLVE